MNICADCDGKKRDKASLCEKQAGSDGLPVLCVGPWAEKKHHYLNAYCSIFTNGMKIKWERRYFIDLFSGPGLCRNKETGQEIDGSPLIAFSNIFTDFIFVESYDKSLDILKSRIAARTDGRPVTFIAGDANEKIDEIITRVPQRDTLILIFGDPFHVHLKMSSLQKLTKTLRADLLLHFPWGTYLHRVVPLPNLQDETKRDIDEFFGATDWRSLAPQNAGVLEYLKLYERQLQQLGYRIGNNFPGMKNSKNATLYYLVYASKHKRGIEFWDKVNKIDPDGQRTLF